MNFAQRFKQKKLEELKKSSFFKEKNSEPARMDSPKSSDIIFQSLNCDLVRLKSFSSGEERNAEKEKLVEIYRPHVERYVENNENYLNPILVNFIIWLIDLKNWIEAIRFYPVAISQGQKMPEHFTRDLKTFVADSLVIFGESQYKNGDNFDFVKEIEEMLNWQLHDQIKGKICRILAETAFAADDLERAKIFAKNGLKFDEKCGLKAFLVKLEKAFKKRK